MKAKIAHIGPVQDRIDEVFEELEKLGFEVLQFEDLAGFESAFATQGKLKPLHMLLVHHDLLEVEPQAWLEQVGHKLKTADAIPPEYPTRIIFIADPSQHDFFRAFRSANLCDVFYKPLDFTQCLQKVAMLAKLPDIHVPKFLYVHKAKERILMTKTAQSLEISDFGFAMENPAEIKVGSIAQFRLPLLSNQETITVTGRAYANANSPNGHKVSFNFLGLNDHQTRLLRDQLYELGMVPLDGPPVQRKQNLSDISEEQAERRALSIKQKMAARATTGPAGRRFTQKHEEPAAIDAPVVPFSKGNLHIAVIDMDRESLYRVQGLINEEIQSAKMYPYPTYNYFFKNELRPRMETGEPPKRATAADSEEYRASTEWVDPAFTMGKKIHLTIQASDKKLVDMSPRPGVVDKICGYSAPDMLSGSQNWLEILHPEFEVQLDELITAAQRGMTAKLDFIFRSKALKTRWFEIEASIKDVPEGQVLLSVEDRPDMESSNFWFNLPDTQDVKSLDAVVMHASFAGADVKAWTDHCYQALIQAGLQPEYDETAFILYSEKTLDPGRMGCARLSALLHAPLDRRQLLEHLGLSSNFQPEPFKKRFLEFYPYIGPMEIGRYVQQEEVTENSVYIKSLKPMTLGSTLIFHSELLTDENGKGVWGRCVANHPHPTIKDAYRTQFLLYNLEQTRLHNLRHEIHKSYVDEKGSGQS